MEELYNLEKDPQELRDIAGKKKSTARKMRAQLQEIIATLDKKRNNSISLSRNNETLDTFDADEEKAVRKGLKGLGYIS